ncbi:MAG: carboxypeptidase-like regulatory domain-containing protein [Gemmatimonadota bacterium]
MRLPAILRLAIVFLAAAPPLLAQEVTDIIRGRVMSDSGKVVIGASVFVTRGPDRAFKQTTTDSTGRYLVSFENGTGDYLVAITSVGLKTARRRVQRQGSERELVADFTLAMDISTLAAVKVTADKPERASNSIGPTQLETGANERWADGVNGQLPPSSLGNLTALTGNLPGVTQGVNGPSILGSGAESNLTTLNGMALPGGTLPRAARVETRVTAASFDPVRGGFSGANTDVRLSAGSRNYQERNAFLTFDTPSLQSTDAVGQSLGARYSSYRGSVGANGYLIPRVMTYSMALDLSRSESDPATLFAGDARALQSAGVSRDSVQRLQTTALTLGVPLAGGGIPSARVREGITWLSRIDDIRDTLNSRQITSYVNLARNGALGFAPLASPSAGGSTTDRSIGVQLQLTDFVGEARRVLTQTKVAVSQSKTSGDPYLALPGAAVLVRSTGTSGEGIVPLTLGGNSSFGRDETRWTGEASNLTMWNARGRKHTFKLFGWGRVDALREAGGADVLGRYAFNSIDDFAAGRAASFSRTLTQPERDGTVWNAAGAVAHQWNPTRFFSLLYGARLEGNGFASSPDRNAALESALGVRTGLAPATLHVSPRVGFSYTFNRDKNNGSGMAFTNSGQYYRTTTGVIRGGIGEFRDLLRPDLLAEASSRTGLAGSTASLLCTGAAVPVPDWSRFLQDAGNIPSTCVDGGGVLIDNAPPATLIARDYQVPRSWRASLDWSANFGWMQVKWNNLASWDLSQASVRDENFAGTQRFTLDAEGGRPVYVSTAGIDASTGAVSATESRRSAAFGRVAVRGSELRGYGAQTTITLAPDVFRTMRAPLNLYGSLSYTLQSSRRQYLGFDGLTAGDPRLREWAPSINDARHIIGLQGAFTIKPIGTFTLFTRAQSGLPFTPQVQGDVNGDGRSGDRAFIPSSAQATDPALASQLLALRTGGSPTAQKCLASVDNELVKRNSCRGPWTATLNMQYRVRMPKALNRLTANVYLENVLAGVDQALHGTDGLRGWGGSASPDPVLLVPRSFDAATRTFRYDVNPRFAETRPSRTTLRSPFRVTLDFSMRLSTDYSLQELRRALAPVKQERRWVPRSADSLTALYLGETSNIHTALLAESDSLFLSAPQIVALRKAEEEYAVQVRKIYTELGHYLQQFAGGAATKAALDSVTVAKKAYWKVFWEQPEIAAGLITPTQRDLMNMLREMLRVPKVERLNSQWMFGNPVRLSKSAAGVVAPASTNTSKP